MQIRAEAAAWLARLHADEHVPDDAANFHAWLRKDQRHQHAFEQVTRAWELAGGAVVPDAGEDVVEPAGGMGRRAFIMAGLATIAAVGAITAFSALTATTAYATEVGEQRRLVLQDGSIIMLDTDTRIEVALRAGQRSVELVKGRAHFQVAPDRTRPFIVKAGDRQVRALGTAFDVSQYDARITVLLVEGRAEVQPVEAPRAAQAIAMTAGERVIFDHAHMIRHDHFDPAEAAAWQSGRLMLDNMLLSEAVAQINRYSVRPLVVRDPGLGARRISGVYDATDAQGFANSVAILLSAQVRVEEQAIFLMPDDPHI